jgi:hypothetical protein
MPPRPLPRRAPPRPAQAPTAVPAKDTITDELQLDAPPVAPVHPPTARIVVRPDTVRVPAPVAAPPVASPVVSTTTVTTSSNGAQLEAQLDTMLKPTTVDDLVRSGRTQNLKTLKESQLRELIRQAVSAVMAQTTGAAPDEATLDRIQSELKRTLAERQREAGERQALEDRLRNAERDLVGERERHNRLVADFQNLEAQAEQANDDFLTAQSDLQIRDGDLAAARARIAVLESRPQGDPELIRVLIDADRAEGGRELAAARAAHAELPAAERAAAMTTARELIRRSKDVTGEAERLRSALAAAEKAVAAAESAVAAAERQLAEARAAAAAERARAGTAESALAAERARSSKAEAELAAARAKLADTDARLAGAADTIARLEAELAERTADRRAPAPAGPAGGAFLAAPGRPRAAWRSADGRAALATRDGAWRVHALDLPGRGPVAGWHRTADASDRLLALSGDGHPVEVVRTAAGKVATNRLDAPAAADDRLSAAIVPAQDAAAVAVRSPDGRLHLLRGSDGRWDRVDLTAVLNAPAAAGPAAVWFWGRENSWHVAYPAADGVLHELFELSGRWYHSRLADGSGAPACAGGLIAWAPGQAEQVLYRGQGGSLHLLSYDGGWRHRDLGVTGAVGTPAGVDLPGGQLVVWRDAAGGVHAIQESAGTLRSVDLAVLSGAPAAAGDPQATRDGEGAIVLYPAADGRLVEVAWQGGWRPAARAG